MKKLIIIFSVFKKNAYTEQVFFVGKTLFSKKIFLVSQYLSTLVSASLVAQRIKHLPAMQETRVRSLGQEDPVEMAMASHPSTLAWKIQWTEKPGGVQSMGSLRVGHD